MSFRNKIGVSGLIFVFSLLAINCTAKEQHIEIKANYMMLNEKNGVGKYNGNVLFTQDDLIIKADSIVVYYKNNQLHRAIIKGQPADVRHYPEGEPEVHSQAKEMEYLVSQERMILIGSAFIKQGKRLFSGERIEYNTRQNTIKAQGKKPSSTTSPGKQKNNRIHVIIGPEDKK